MDTLFILRTLFGEIQRSSAVSAHKGSLDETMPVVAVWQIVRYRLWFENWIDFPGIVWWTLQFWFHYLIQLPKSFTCSHYIFGPRKTPGPWFCSSSESERIGHANVILTKRYRRVSQRMIWCGHGNDCSSAAHFFYFRKENGKIRKVYIRDGLIRFPVSVSFLYDLPLFHTKNAKTKHDIWMQNSDNYYLENDLWFLCR